MSLISDPSYLIHSLRLSYLRNVDDPYGARLVTLSPSYISNPYILAASLADVERWPELAMPTSPQVSDDEGESSSNTKISSAGFPGATGLRHSQTIMGGRSGGLGLRVSGKRLSASKRASIHSGRASISEGTAVATPKRPIRSGSVEADSRTKVLDGVNGGSSLPAQSNVQIRDEPAPPEPPPKEMQFVPRFKGAAEMEARRKLRQAQRGLPIGPPLGQKPPIVITANLNPDLSSSDEGEDLLDDENDDDEDGDGDDDDFDNVQPGDDIMDEADEFDPDFAATRTPGVNSDSASDVISVLSGTASAASISNPSALASSPQAPKRSRLSPVSEGHVDEDGASPPDPRGNPLDLTFEMVTPAPQTEESAAPVHKQLRARGATISYKLPVAPPSDMTFMRRVVGPVGKQKSALTAMLMSSGRSSNPFSELYAAISGRGETSATDVKVYFPHAKKPSGEIMTLNVRKDASVEEVIGFALWTYWEEGWLPKLDEGITDEDNPKLTAVGWIMRIAEDDGEVDEDFPPPDRTGKVLKFNFDAFAVLRATPIQILQNQQLEANIQRRASRVMATPKKTEQLLAPPGPAPSTAFGPSTSALLGTTPILSSSLGPSSSHGPQIFLRIHVADTADAVHISTTIPVSAGMYMQESLELVCRKRKLANPKDYALILNEDEMSILIPLDRTVASLQGKRELTLVKRSMLPQLGIEPERRTARTTDPNASIFKRISDVPEVQISAAMDFTAAYKKYTIYRKMPMLTRQERTLAIDGVYIHIMPSTNKAKAVFDSGKTTSFHIKSIIACQQSTKSSTIFKIVVQRDSRNKRYDFEADSPKLAGEIVQTIRSLKAALDRTLTTNKSRRSRQVV